MRLSVHTDYAIRVLIYLGINTDRLCTIREISESYGISNNHLVKVVHRLAKAGYIHSVRGKGGGIRMERDPYSITVGQVVREMEFDFEIVECFNTGTNTCKIARACRLKRTFSDALEVFLQSLDQQTIGYLIEPERKLRQLLKAPNENASDAA